MIRARHARLATRFLAHRFRELHPFEVQAVLLNACDLHCTYCKCPEIKTALLTTAQWRTVIRQLGGLGTLRIKFQGGEPTLRRDFRDLCAATQAEGILTAVITNGLAVGEHPELLDHLDEIVFSLDAAHPEINDRLRGAGTHARVIRAIELARQRQLPTYVNMVVNRENFSELEAMLELCEHHGARLNAQPVMFDRKYYNSAARHLGLGDDQIREMHRRMAEWKQQGRGLMFSARTYLRVADWPDYTQPSTRSEGASTCMAGRFYIHIEANGDVHPCVQYEAAFTPKNVIRDGIEEALRNVQHHNCGDCFVAYLNERKDLFALRPAALRELVRRS